MWFGKYIKKSHYRSHIDAQVRKAVKKTKEKYVLYYDNIVKNIVKAHKKIIQKYKDQHNRDLKARKLMNRNRDYFRKHRDYDRDKIISAIQDVSRLMAHYDKGDMKDADAEKKDGKVVKFQRPA